MAHSWPGNVRQLENVMERAFALSPGRPQIVVSDLPDEMRTAAVPMDANELVIPEAGIDMEQRVADFEHRLIRRALEMTSGNKRQAADLTGHPQGLRRCPQR